MLGLLMAVRTPFVFKGVNSLGWPAILVQASYFALKKKKQVVFCPLPVVYSFWCGCSLRGEYLFWDFQLPNCSLVWQRPRFGFSWSYSITFIPPASTSYLDFCFSNKSFMPSDVLKLVFAYCFFPTPGFQWYINLSVISAEISSVLVVSLGPCSSADWKNLLKAYCLYCNGIDICASAVVFQLMTWCAEI